MQYRTAIHSTAEKECRERNDERRDDSQSHKPQNEVKGKRTGVLITITQHLLPCAHDTPTSRHALQGTHPSLQIQHPASPDHPRRKRRMRDPQSRARVVGQGAEFCASSQLFTSTRLACDGDRVECLQQSTCLGLGLGRRKGGMRRFHPFRLVGNIPCVRLPRSWNFGRH